MSLTSLMLKIIETALTLLVDFDLFLTRLGFSGSLGWLITPFCKVRVLVTQSFFDVRLSTEYRVASPL